MECLTLPIHRGGLWGTVTLPTSKSLTNRALIASAVADGGTIVAPLDCVDTRVLAAALRTAGWPVDWGSEIQIGERTVPEDLVSLDLADSGTGSRLILALLAASRGRSVIDGSARLRERPMAPLLESLTCLGAGLSSRGGFLPVEMDGDLLRGGAIEIEPGISSQFVSALVMAGPLMAQGPRPRGIWIVAVGAISGPHRRCHARLWIRTRGERRQAVVESAPDGA